MSSSKFLPIATRGCDSYWPQSLLKIRVVPTDHKSKFVRFSLTALRAKLMCFPLITDQNFVWFPLTTSLPPFQVNRIPNSVIPTDHGSVFVWFPLTTSQYLYTGISETKFKWFDWPRKFLRVGQSACVLSLVFSSLSFSTLCCWKLLYWEFQIDLSKLPVKFTPNCV